MNADNQFRLLAAMLADIYKHFDIKGDVNAKLVSDALWNRQEWAIGWEHDFLLESEENPPEVKYVVSVLDMWRFIEGGYNDLGQSDRTTVAESVPYREGQEPRFGGFDGNDEAEYMGVARMLIEHMGRFSEFSGRDLNTHSATTARYTAMLGAFGPIRDGLSFGPARGLSASQIIEILKAPYQ